LLRKGGGYRALAGILAVLRQVQSPSQATPGGKTTKTAPNKINAAYATL
jgi:hypothetical protein